MPTKKLLSAEAVVSGEGERVLEGWCQTNANQSPKSTIDLNSGGELAPFGQSCGAVLLECFSAV